MNNEYKIIGLLGRSRVGKDTVANYLCEKYLSYENVKLSLPLKKAVCELYGFTMDKLETSSKDEIDNRWNKTPRETIQSLTKYMMEYMGIDFFTRRLYNMYDNGMLSKNIIITDIRYNHDIQEIKRRGGLVIKIERPNNSIHNSVENNIDDLKGDITIYNDGTLEELYEKINQSLNSIVIA